MSDAVVLAVMSDTTPDLESETEHLRQVGDRIVVAGRGARTAQVVAALHSRSSPTSS